MEDTGDMGDMGDTGDTEDTGTPPWWWLFSLLTFPHWRDAVTGHGGHQELGGDTRVTPMVVAHLHPDLPHATTPRWDAGATSRATGGATGTVPTALTPPPPSPPCHRQRRRYETYVQVLETWLRAGTQDLEGWEARAGPAAAPPDPPTLTKAHSSPSLAPEPPRVPAARVRRNVSERRTVRRIVPKRSKNLL